MKRQEGFNLIELMIVISIMGLLIGIGAIAYNTVIKNSNETAAVSFVEKIVKAQAQYATSNKGNFAKNFTELIESGFLDERFKGENPEVSGYIFEIKANEKQNKRVDFFQINAKPETDTGVTATGNRYFYYDSAVSLIKFTKEKRNATKDDEPIL